ncbi:suppressor of fused domain protein [Chitinimonas sp.]|uniref:suppressor of fused domain protein n=1 Tax=Chitinimonas sp. TaxID=1934313 RepID=UPI002F94BDD4
MSLFEKLFGRKKSASTAAGQPVAEQTIAAPDDEDEDVGAAGWEAIDAALHPLYGDQQPAHYGTVLSYRLGGQDPLQGISVYKREEPVRHWHYITYGFSELYDKESEDPAISGWGFELTFRLRVDAFEAQPPTWPLNFLQNLARYVFQSGRVFNEGDYMNANGPIAVDEDTALVAIAFVQDPELSAIDTPNGALRFLQVVGVTEDESFAQKQWNTLGVMEVFAPHMPLYATDLKRQSLMQIESVRQQVQAGAEREGSNTGYLLVDQLACELSKAESDTQAVKLTLGAAQVPTVLSLLPYRLRFKNHFGLIGKGIQVWLKSAERCDVAQNDEEISIFLSDEVVDAICTTLPAKQGTYQFAAWDGLSIEVKPTYIRDQDGNVVNTVGE